MPELKERPKKLVLVEDPMTTKDMGLLEKILELTKNFRYLDVVQYGPMWRNLGVPSNTDKEPLDEYLPGGRIIRVKYIVKEIIDRYQRLENK